MGPEVVVLQAPLLNEDLRLEERVEALPVEALISQLAVEGLDVAVLPGAAGLDEERPHPDPLQPAAHRPGGELGAVVAADVGGNATAHEELGETGEHLGGGQTAGDDDGEALARVLIDDGQELEDTAVSGALEEEVVGPDVVGTLRTAAHDGAVGQPEAAPFRLLGRHLQPLLAPETLDSLVVHLPALLSQKRGDAAVAVASEA